MFKEKDLGIRYLTSKCPIEGSETDEKRMGGWSSEVKAWVLHYIQQVESLEENLAYRQARPTVVTCRCHHSYLDWYACKVRDHNSVYKCKEWFQLLDVPFKLPIYGLV